MGQPGQRHLAGTAEWDQRMITIPMWLTSKTQMGSQERKGWEKWVGARQPRAIGAHAEGMGEHRGFLSKEVTQPQCSF